MIYRENFSWHVLLLVQRAEKSDVFFEFNFEYVNNCHYLFHYDSIICFELLRSLYFGKLSSGGDRRPFGSLLHAVGVAFTWGPFVSRCSRVPSLRLRKRFDEIDIDWQIESTDLTIDSLYVFMTERNVCKYTKLKDDESGSQFRSKDHERSDTGSKRNYTFSFCGRLWLTWPTPPIKLKISFKVPCTRAMRRALMVWSSMAATDRQWETSRNQESFAL